MAKKVTTAEKPAEHDAGIPAQIKNPKEREAWKKRTLEIRLQEERSALFAGFFRESPIYPGLNRCFQ